MMMPDVRCSVSNCANWGQGNFCQANSIIVQTEAYEYAQDYQNSVGDVLENAILNGEIQTNAVHSGETCCHSFRPRM